MKNMEKKIYVSLADAPTQTVLCTIYTLFAEGLPSLEDLKNKVLNGKEIKDLSKIRHDVDEYVNGLKKRLNNIYASSIKAFLTKKGEIVLVGYDDRTRQESNYALVRGRDIFCWAGNARNDGHLNEFINNSDGYIPNSIYHLENVIYVTNNKGFVEYTYEYHTTKRYTDRNYARPSYSYVINEKGCKPDDVGGHIVAHCIDGPSEAINILPMNSTFNNGKEWKKMENELNSEYQNDKDFRIIRHIEYEPNSQRPIKIEMRVFFEASEKFWSFYL